MICAMTPGQVALFAMDSPHEYGEADLERAATATIDALRAQNAIQPWHELDCQIVLDLSRAVTQSKGIAKSQMFGALLAARARLPEPVVAETDGELILFEAERDLEWERVHGDDDDGDTSDVSHGAVA